MAGTTLSGEQTVDGAKPKGPKDPTANKRQKKCQRRINEDLTFIRGDAPNFLVKAMIERRLLVPKESKDPELVCRAVVDFAIQKINITP